jgi:hypothetical protein
MSQIKKIPLAELLKDLRTELLTARSEGQDSELRFEVTHVELEVNIAATKEAGGGGGGQVLGVQRRGQGQRVRRADPSTQADAQTTARRWNTV